MGVLKGKLIVLAVCGSVAAVRAFDLCRELRRKGAKVKVVMSRAATEMVGMDLMQYASGSDVITRLSGKVEHVELLGAEGTADLLLIAPATANTISKIAMGIDDTVITTLATTAIGSKTPVLVVPAMHYSMWEHPIVEENLERLKGKDRVKVIEPIIAENKAKIASIGRMVLESERAMGKQKLGGKKVLITSGACWEEIDPIRVLTSKSSGKTGRELALEAYRQGAEVTIVGQDGIGDAARHIKVKSAKEMMAETLLELKNGYDVFISAAAISDFTVKKRADKIGSGKKVKIELIPNKKLIGMVRKQFPGLFMVGFKAETNKNWKKLISEGKTFLTRGNLQLVVANDVAGKGIGEDENEVFIIAPGGRGEKVSGSKAKIAEAIIKKAAFLETESRPGRISSLAK